MNMNRITTFFLSAKSWEMFLVFFGLMALSMVAMFNSIQAEPARDFGKGTLPFFVCALLVMIGTLGWFGAVGWFLNSTVQPGLRPAAGIFRFALVYPVLYVVAFMILFPPSPAEFVILLPLHMIAILCLFYLPIFVSKNLALVEMRKSVTFSDYATAFFLLWFLPIGVWVVQPRINRLYAEAKNSLA
jgi:hypothetical protein